MLFLCMVLVLIAIGAELINPYIVKMVIDDYIVGQKPDFHMGLMSLSYFGVVMLSGILSYAQTFLLNRMGQGIMHRIRMELFGHIQNLPMGFFDQNSSGRILTRVSNDIEALSEMFSGVLINLFKDVFLILGILYVMFSLSTRLALISLSVVPVLALVTWFYNQRARKNYKWVRSLIASINGFLAENFSGMKIVQIFNLQKAKFKEFTELNSEYNRAGRMEVILMALFKPGTELVNNLAVSILVWACIGSVFNGVLEIGVVFAFVTYVKKFFAPISDLADKYNVILSGSVSAERIFELLDVQEGKEDLDRGEPLPATRGAIEFRHVWFAYKDKDWVLRDVSFRVEPGQTVALVGATGSGKSTIINLISRYYEIQKGQILLDGVDIRTFRLRDLRRRIAVVMQEVFLFAGDIKSNIRLNEEDISLETVQEAASLVNADEFIRALPDGYDEEVKERGCTLSAGERQLLSFARALAFDPSILVLDEATATIDTETECIIQNSLKAASRGRTTLVIAHRLSTIREADQIIVIHKGRIRETGRHNELLEQGGIYKNLHDMQFCRSGGILSFQGVCGEGSALDSFS
ncbi:MAG TPA: ABC transporter ATP-binding protein [Clostridiales bacterium]|nr:ABC transporter ATP-binding protein [Clostridiales bacterium]